MSAFNVTEAVVAVVEADTPQAARMALRSALTAHGFDCMGVESSEPMLGAWESEPDSPAHPLPPACQDRNARAWADVVEQFAQWKLTPWQAQNLVRLAAAAVDSGEIGERGQLSELHSFSDPDEIAATARRAWKAISYLGDGEPADEPPGDVLSPVVQVMSDPAPGPVASALLTGRRQHCDVPSSRRSPTAEVPMPRLASPLAQQLVDWADQGWTATAYLATGAVVSTDGWCADVQDRMLMFFGDHGVMHLIDPSTVYAIHLGPPEDRHSGFCPSGR